MVGRDIVRWIVLFVSGATVACGGTTKSTGTVQGGTTAGTSTAVASGGAPALDGGAAGMGGSSGSKVCEVVTGSYGNCEMVLGWGFDGTACRLYSGCDCSPNCGSLFATALDCARACRLEQHCNVAKFKGGGIGSAVVEGAYCDDIFVCSGQAKAEDLAALLDLPDACETSTFCAAGMTCEYAQHAYVSSDDWNRLCMVSLLPVDSVVCWVWGP
jgi:hypothetical protein